MYGERHESLHGLRRLFSGEAGPAEGEWAASHLMQCRECRLRAARAMAAQQAKGKLVVPESLRLIAAWLEIEQRYREKRLEAQASWLEIRSLGPKARRDKVRLTRVLHTLDFVEVLLEEGAEAATPAESEEICYLALLAAGQLPSSSFPPDLKSDICAECCAELANARRRQARWPAARDALRKGNDYAERGSKDGVVEGKLLCVAGALEDDLGNTEEAARLLRRAVEHFRAEKEALLECRTLVQLANVLVDVDPKESLQIVGEALVRLRNQGNNPRLVLFAEGIKVSCLIALGSPQEALLRFGDLKDLHEQFREPAVQLRRRFAAGRLLEHLGRPQKAEILFQEVIAGDLEHGLVKDFFLDLVYLFGFHLRRGQSSEAIAVCRRASQELSLLDDEDGSGESARDQMQMVWRALEEEVKRGTVDLGVTTVLRNYIKAHWRFPADDPPSFGGRS